MIKQPEIGLKLAELRKSKGLTQEELVDRCNINVRTIQRIENGLVSPRISTLRILFEALECKIEIQYMILHPQNIQPQLSNLPGLRESFIF